MGEQTKLVSMDVEQRRALPECSWGELSEPGTYVEKETGDLYRIPKAPNSRGGSVDSQGELTGLQTCSA
jgi:hypothetical protein